jgi:hypothetical protein
MGDNDPLYEGTTPTTEKLLWHDVKIKTVDGKPFAYAGKLTIDDDYPRLGKRQWVQPFELQEIHLNPDMTTAFIPDAPEGIRVFNAEDRETQYVWHNGHVIKRADLRSAVAADAKVPGLVWTDWRVIAFACLILLTIPITLVSWYVRRRKPKAA